MGVGLIPAAASLLNLFATAPYCTSSPASWDNEIKEGRAEAKEDQQHSSPIFLLSIGGRVPVFLWFAFWWLVVEGLIAWLELCYVFAATACPLPAPSPLCTPVVVVQPAGLAAGYT